jgi:hypothetical protein
MEPLALILYRRFREGETMQDLAEQLAIPEDRVGQRLRAAALYYDRQRMQQNLVVLGERVKQADRSRPV